MCWARRSLAVLAVVLDADGLRRLRALVLALGGRDGAGAVTARPGGRCGLRRV